MRIQEPACEVQSHAMFHVRLSKRAQGVAKTRIVQSERVMATISGEHASEEI